MITDGQIARTINPLFSSCVAIPGLAASSTYPTAHEGSGMEDRTLQLPAGTPIGRVTVAITPAEEAAPTGRRLLAKLLDLQAAIPVAAGLSQEQIDTALEHERASWG